MQAAPNSVRERMHSRNRSHAPLLIVFGALVLTLSGCSQIRVTSDFDPQANFARLQTYAWLPDLNPTNDPRLDTKLLDSHVRAVVERELAAKGYRKVDGGTPSFHVAYHVYVHRETLPARNPVVGYSYSWWAARGAVNPPQYDEGSLLLDIVDPQTNALMWRGWASGTVQWKASPKERAARVDKGIADLLAKFPPPAK